jgi:hypothetical protein
MMTIDLVAAHSETDIARQLLEIHQGALPTEVLCLPEVEWGAIGYMVSNIPYTTLEM